MAADAAATLLLQQPDIGDREVTFAYDDDIWIAARNGGHARRLTSATGAETNPHLSPDGSIVAFSGNYDGNVAVYVVPATGGPPTRLTWHGGPDIVQGFPPNGRIMFSSYRDLYADRMIQLYSVSINGGMPQRLPVPDGDDAQVSPDGSRIAYSTMPPAYKDAVPQAKNHRGGGRLVYEHAGALYVFDPASERRQRLSISAGAELLQTRVRYLSDLNYVRAVTPTPDASRFAVEYRGEIVEMLRKEVTTAT